MEHGSESQHVTAAAAIAGPFDGERSRQCDPRCTRDCRTETGRESEKKSHGALVTPAMTAVSKLNDLGARLGVNDD